MALLNDLTGKKFGRLTVIERTENKGKYVAWLCKCECGNVGSYRGSSLTTRNTSSCGCVQTIHGHASGTDREASSEYVSWNGMMDRCTNENSTNYKNYGHIGIKVCDRWYKFSNFLLDMGEKPSKEHSIDRIDVYGNYEPSNCRWSTRFQQDTNKRISRRNKTGHSGVYFEKPTNKYRSNIGAHGKIYKTKRFENIEDAIDARKKLEEKYWKGLS